MKLYGKKSALERLEMFYSSGRVPHALLLTGDEGVGKRTLADYAVMLALCEKKGGTPCFSCNECMRIEQHIHPDVIYPLRESKNGKYSTAELVEFVNNCNRVPNDAQFRFYIFEQAEEMNVSCQNALLKFIEEPLRFNRFIFTASDKGRILETIISRVTEIKVPAAEESECLSALSERGIARDEAMRLYRTFGGNIGRCISAHEDEGKLALFMLSEKIAEAVACGREYDCLVLFTSVKTREELGEILKNLTDIFGNAAVLYAGGKPCGFFSEKSETIAARMTLKKINKIYEAAIELLKAMDFNPNTALAAAGCCAKLFNAAEKLQRT